MTTLKSERDGTTSFNHTTLMALVVFYTPLMTMVVFYTPLMTVVVHVGLLHYPDGCGGLFTTLMAVKVSPTTFMARSTLWSREPRAPEGGRRRR